MQDFMFTGLWPQTPGNPLATFTYRGATPIDALVRFWATCLPDTALGTPMRCEADGHTYHCRLNEQGQRQITIISVPVQGTIVTI